MGPTEENMFFFIADISGYTSFMLKNRKDFEHGKLIILNLMETLIQDIEVPFQISKLEGDAIFLYMREEDLKGELKENPLHLTKKILQFFDSFSEKLRELKESAVCQCGGCLNISNLNLKIVAHYGTATMDKIGQFMELSGVDVIIAHRLLKNTIEEKRYLVLTEPAFEKLPLPEEGRVTRREEHYEDIGKIPVIIYYPPGYEPKPEAPRYNTPLTKLKNLIKLDLTYFFVTLGLKKLPPYQNIPPEEKSSNALKRR